MKPTNKPDSANKSVVKEKKAVTGSAAHAVEGPKKANPVQEPVIATPTVTEGTLEPPKSPA